MSSPGFGALDELARRPDAPVLVVHVPADVIGDSQIAAAHARYGGAMVVLPLTGHAGRAESLKGRDVVLWPWRGLPGERASLETFEAALSRSASRLRVIVPNDVDDYLGPADLNGHDPVAWARTRAKVIPPREAVDLEQEWFGAPATAAESVPLEETHERVTDPQPADWGRSIWDDEATKQILADDARPRFQFHAALDLVKEPTPTDWLLQGWFERNTLACYFGDPGSCKTWIALSQAVHIAYGWPWLGGARVTAGAVFILCGEGQRGFRRRLEGIRKHHEMEFDHVPLYVSEGPAQLTEPESVADVISAVQTLVDIHGVTPVLVVVDTLSRNFGSADENSTPDMTAFVGACDRIRAAWGCTVLIVHHSGHGDKTRGRGNSALRAALDAEFRFDRDKEGGQITATCTKAKDFEMPEPRAYELANVALDWAAGDDGLPVSSAAVVESAWAATSTPTSTPTRTRTTLGANQAGALAALRELIGVKQRRIAATGGDPAKAAVMISEWEDAAKLPNRQRFYEARKALEKAGIVNSDGIEVHINES